MKFKKLAVSIIAHNHFKTTTMIRAEFIIDHLEFGSLTRLKFLLKKTTAPRDALSKAMKLRKLTPETCAVYRSDQRLEKLILVSGRCRDASKTPIFWDTDITALEGDEIRVEVS